MVDRGKSFQVVANLIMVLLVLFCLVPFVLLIVSSITQENSLVRNGYSFIPEKIDFSAYKYLLVDSGSIVRGYILSAIVTVVGTVLNLTLTTLFAYRSPAGICQAGEFWRSFCFSPCSLTEAWCRVTSCGPRCSISKTPLRRFCSPT